MSQKRNNFGGFSLGGKASSGPPKRPKIGLFADDEEEEKKPARPLITLDMQPPIVMPKDPSKVNGPAPAAAGQPPRNVESAKQQSEHLEKPMQKEKNLDESRRDEKALEEEPDPLDAFMQDMEQQEVVSAPKVIRQDIEDEDDHETLFRHLKERDAKEKGINVKDMGSDDDDIFRPDRVVETKEEELEYDEEGNPIRRKNIGPIPPLDHAKIDYPEFNKDFYLEHAETKDMTEEQVKELRRKEEIHVSGVNIAKPILSFRGAGLEPALLKEITKQNFTTPTAIQKQALPIAMSGRDIIGIAKTGSGKTAAFVWPMIPHILDQHELEKGDGPIAIILAPTRELAHQIYLESKKYCKPNAIQCAAVYGGISKTEQYKSLRNGAEVIVATPGRLIDMIKAKACKMNRVTYLVLDEADKMFDMGFEPQIRSIEGQIRPDRQTLLFSATFKRKVETLARDILSDPIRINIGGIGQANEDITQIVEIFEEYQQKWNWLDKYIREIVKCGSVIIFGSTKQSTEDITSRLLRMGLHAAAIHGDKDQADREKIMYAFKNNNLPILVATDVAARGLDVKGIKNVINFEVARNIDSHTHRIGRTGRAGEKGWATTLMVKGKDSNFAGDLVRNLEGANQYVSPALLELAMQNPHFSKNRSRLGGGGSTGKGAPRGNGAGRGKGRAATDRTGLGFSDAGGFGSNVKKAAPRGPPLSAPLRATFVAASDGTMQASMQAERQFVQTQRQEQPIARPILPPFVPPPPRDEERAPGQRRRFSDRPPSGYEG
ncbi:hypothetical protein PROFUN_13951 [Planoprotostelium fungivorum]|uniref:RNA helicase n=1 Tax=Planoprotostelium fungivorum TaxID=1890364 RepID=A0A2P6N2G2_9EUKA|nr:hypothetical protein PROFUN_13951 [Planoprotostelium fungivorum]